MACTAPINVVVNVENTCDRKCKYSFSYPRTSLVVTNRGKYIEFKCEKTQEPPVIFNNVKYNVNEFRIYAPSLHTYGGQHAKGEFIIYHTDTYSDKQLLVSIPIQVGAAVGVKENIIGDIVKKVANHAPANMDTTTIKLDTFTLNNIVPKKPFYTYKGSLLSDTEDNCIDKSSDYVIFDTTNSIVLSDKIYTELQNVIVNSGIATVETTNKLYYNKVGAGYLGDEGDDIWISCEPTGHSGHTTVEQSSSSDIDIGNKYSIKNLFDSSAGLFFKGIILLLITVKSTALIGGAIAKGEGISNIGKKDIITNVVIIILGVLMTIYL